MSRLVRILIGLLMLALALAAMAYLYKNEPRHSDCFDDRANPWCSHD